MRPTWRRREDWTVLKTESVAGEEWRGSGIVDGALVMHSAPSGDHELVSEDIRAAIRVALDPALVVVGPMAVTAGDSYLIPDLLVVERERVRGRPTLEPRDVLLVVEVVTPGSITPGLIAPGLIAPGLMTPGLMTPGLMTTGSMTKDRLGGLARYAAAGIAHLWRVVTDPVGLTVYELAAGATAYHEVGVWTATETALIERPFPVTVELSRLAS